MGGHFDPSPQLHFTAVVHVHVEQMRKNLRQAQDDLQSFLKRISLVTTKG